MRSTIVWTAILTAFTLTAADRAREIQLQQAMDLIETKGDLPRAIRLLETVAKSPDRNLAARSLLYLGDCRQKLGQREAVPAYERVVREFSDQREVAAQAQMRLLALRAASPSGSGITTRQIWTGPKVDIMGDVSVDGKYLSFTDWETGDLAVHDLSTGQDRRLTNKGTWAESNQFAEESAISRDGKRVAYSWFNKDLRYELRLLALNAPPGAQPRTLLQGEDIDWVGPYDWSPDGNTIAVQVTRQNLSGQIGLVSADTGSLKVLRSVTVGGNGPTKMVFSPDGKYLAYDLPGGPQSDQHDIFLTSVEEGSETALVVHPATDIVLGWTPDGSHLLFASDRTGNLAVWAIAISGGKRVGEPRLIKPELAWPWGMGTTRSGALYYGMPSGDRDIHVASIDFQTGKILTAPAKPIQRYVGSNLSPDWSPDGKYLAYSSRHEPTGNHWNIVGIWSAETGEVRELRPRAVYVFQLHWAPDGNSFVAEAMDRQGRRGVFRMDARTAELTPIVLSQPGTEAQRPRWSSDGSVVFYTRYEFKAREYVFVARELASGTEREIIRRRSLSNTVVSPDGRQVVWTETAGKSRDLMIAPMAEGSPRQLVHVEGEDAGGFNFLAWSPDSQSVIVRKPRGAGQPDDLLVYPADGGSPRRLDLNGTGVRTLRVHPDGKRVAFMAGDARYEVWVMENFLPALAK